MLWNGKNGSVRIGQTEMDYVRFGRGPGTLILLPGLSDGLATVRGKALLLARPYRSFFEAFTVYMFSRKRQMPEDYSIRDMAADQAAALYALGVEHAGVMGVSQGGMVAQALAIGHPALVEKLVIAVSAPNANETVQANLDVWMKLAAQGDHKALMIDTAEKSYSEAYLKRLRKAYPVIGLIGRPKDYRRFLINARAIAGFDVRADLASIRCPTLILGGGNDHIVGAQAAREMHERIIGSKLHIYPRLGHAAYEEAPDFNDRIFRFLTET